MLVLRSPSQPSNNRVAPRWTFARIIVISMRRSFAEQLQLGQDGIYHFFLLVKDNMLLLSQIFLMFKPPKQAAHFVRDHIDRNTLGLGKTCHF